MAEKSPPLTSVDAYIAGFSPEVQAILEKIRTVIKEAAPNAVEKISYQMPGYYLNGGLVWFGAFKHHIGLYPTPGGLTEFSAELEAYPQTKGSVHFPYDRPVPYDLIRKIVEYRLSENLKKKRS